MVLVERNPAENLRNGRSRGSSPNGHAGGSPDSSDDDSTKKTGSNKTTKAKSEYEEKIRVGKDYQTICPDLIPACERRPEMLNDRALLVWSPTKDIPDSKLEEYITVAKEKYGYNGEQALGMLFWHKHDLERAVMDLANFTPFPDEWTDEDKVLFEQAFQFHGKSFHRIRQMLPDKTIASLVKYYYSWKKTRSRTSVMDRQEKIKTKDGSENGSENGSNEESDSEEKKWPLYRGIRRASGSPPPPSRMSDESNNSVTSSATKQANANATVGTTNGNATHYTDNKNNNGTSSSTTVSNSSTSNVTSSNDTLTTSTPNGCFGCGVPCSHTNSSPHGALCNSCYHHWSRTGTLRPTSGPGYGKRMRGASTNNNGLERHKSKLPRGMYINHDDIVTLACPENNGQSNRNDDLLASMDREISSLLSQIQNNKQIVSSLKRKSVESVDDLYPNDLGNNRLNSRWNSDELLLAVKGVRKYGKDFQAIAELLGTKTEAQVRTFFASYRRKYNLDSIVKEHQHEQHSSNNQQNNKDDQKLINSLSHNSNNNNKSSDDDVMEIDLSDEIPNNKYDDDEDVAIIEKVDTSATVPNKVSNTDGILTNITADLMSLNAASSANSIANSSNSITVAAVTSHQQQKTEQTQKSAQKDLDSANGAKITVTSSITDASKTLTDGSTLTTTASNVPIIAPNNGVQSQQCG